MGFFRKLWPFGRKKKSKPKPKARVRRPGSTKRLTRGQSEALGGALDKLAVAAGKQAPAKPDSKPKLPAELIVKKPVPQPKPKAKPANIRLAERLAVIKIPEADVLAALKDPKGRVAFTKIIAGADLPNPEKVVARIERRLAAGKTFQQIIAEAKAEA